MACADVATAKEKAATAINLIIVFLPCWFSGANHAGIGIGYLLIQAKLA
jgi:hypothetical protein